MAGEKEVTQDDGTIIAGDPPDEGFGDAFAEASEEKPTGEEKAEVKDEEKKSDEIKDEKKSEIKSEEEIKKPEEKAETPESLEQKYKTLQGMYNQLKEKEEKPPEKKEEKKEEAPPDYSLLFQDLPADLSDDIRAELAEYEEEYDHISKYEGIKREQLAKRLIGLMNVSFQKFHEQIAPYLKATAETAQSTHYSAIKQAHTDFEEIRDSGKLNEWIDAKPKYMRDAMKTVYKAGDTQDVIDLFKQFKEETGYKPDKSQGKKKAEEKNLDKENSLELVRTREAGIPPAPSKKQQAKEDDFSAAFAEASQK